MPNEMIRIPKGVRKGSVRIDYADNQIAILINGNFYWHIRTESRPPVDKTIPFEIAGRGLTVLTILGANWGGPYHYRFQLQIDGCEIALVNYAGDQSDNGIDFFKTYDLVAQDDYGDYPFEGMPTPAKL